MDSLYAYRLFAITYTNPWSAFERVMPISKESPDTINNDESDEIRSYLGQQNFYLAPRIGDD